MNELSQVRTMLRRAQIEFTETQGSHEGERTILIDVERGYSGFHTVLEFSVATGLLVDVGAYE